MIRQRPWFAAVIAFVTVLGIGGIAFGAQAVFEEAPVETTSQAATPAQPSVAREARATATVDTERTTVTTEKGEKVEPDTPEPDHATDKAVVEEAKQDPAKDTTPPELVILEPIGGAEFTEKVVTFAGEAEPGSTVTAGKYVADIDESGRWSIVLVLSPGANKASFAATDAAGNVTTASIVVHLTVEKPAVTDDAKSDDGAAVVFTANQIYGSCEESPPYDVFWGTATPGSKVKVWSEYGSAKVHAGEFGDWEVKVPFASAPFGKPFTVTVTSGDSIREFPFTSYADPGPVEYAVSQIKASSDSPEPYAKFAGTAEAGTVIEATSAYGSSSLVVETAGEWWLKVHFTGQPANEPFRVDVMGAGQVHEFSFIWYQGEG